MGYLLHHLLSESAARGPGAIAVRHGGDALTYAELERRSNKLAHALIARGVQRGDRIGLHMPKSVDMVACLFAVLKSGACYVPLDLSLPPGRVGDIARQCGMRCILTTAPRLEKLTAEALGDTALDWALVVDCPSPPSQSPLPCSTMALESEDQPESAPDVPGIDQDLAYVLFTSGSTGSPKGVMLSHLNALTFVNWGWERFAVGPEDRLSNHAPLSFDLAVFDIFVAIKAGASVSLVPDGLARFPIRLAELIERERISVWYSVPSILRMLQTHGRLGERDLSALRLVLFAGEVYPVRHLRALMEAAPRPRYFNLYGPTETNVCTYHEVVPFDDDRVTTIPIGRPCRNTDALLIDEHGHLVTTPGKEALLYIRGSTVMQGYYGRARETEATFIANPYAPGRQERLYCTQDWVMLDADDNFLFLGRRDHMVKTGGYRVELGEIEAALCDHPDVSEAAAVPIPDDLLGNRIHAVVVRAPDSSVSVKEIRRHCSRRLPKYMVPQEVDFEPALPRTSNDKIDRTRLQAEVLANQR